MDVIVANSAGVSMMVRRVRERGEEGGEKREKDNCPWLLRTTPLALLGT